MMRVKMHFERETKNTYRFKDSSEGAPIDVLYVRKSAFVRKAPGEGQAPKSITVTVEVDSEGGDQS